VTTIGPEAWAYRKRGRLRCFKQETLPEETKRKIIKLDQQVLNLITREAFML
jgi:hypothetical protein